MKLKNLKSELNRLKNKGKAKILSRYFKTGRGEYGQGDKFLGVTVPRQRSIAKKYKELSFDDLRKLLSSKIHEHRCTAFLILIEKYKIAEKKEKGGAEAEKKKIFNFSVKNIKNANSWDLVDAMSPKIIGNFLLEKNKNILYKLAKSNNLWERRIAIISTFPFIKKNRFSDTLKIAKILLADKHDLIHKAVGWMFREIGKKDQNLEEKFLKENINRMPRTALRYAIERFGNDKKRYYMSLGKSRSLDHSASK